MVTNCLIAFISYCLLTRNYYINNAGGSISHAYYLCKRFLASNNYLHKVINHKVLPIFSVKILVHCVSYTFYFLSTSISYLDGLPSSCPIPSVKVWDIHFHLPRLPEIYILATSPSTSSIHYSGNIIPSYASGCGCFCGVNTNSLSCIH